MAKKDETKEVKETTKEAPKKEAPKKEAPQEAKKEKKEDKKHDDKKHEGKGEDHSKKDRKGAPKEGKKEVPKETGPEIKHIVRIADTDLDGKRSVQLALTSIKGISRRLAKIVAVNACIEPNATIGYLEDASIEKLQTSIDNISMIVPFWMMNKQNDFMTGEDKHLIGIDVTMGLNEDINLMKKMRSYKGVRHDKGLKVRGQRTRSTGRKGRTVGVSRTALQAGKAKEEKKPEAKGAGK